MSIDLRRIVALALFAAAGCATAPLAAARSTPSRANTSSVTESAEDTIPTDMAARARTIRVLAEGTLECPYQIAFLGPVDVHEPVANEDAALELLKLRAAALGAEAINHVEFEHGDDGMPTHLSGAAIRCQNIRHGLGYDVIGPVEVTIPMGHEYEALPALRAATRARGGNHTVDIRFEHGEAENESIHVTGTAVRLHE